MELIKPIQGVAEEEAGHFAAAVVIDEGVPTGDNLPVIGVFVQRRAVKCARPWPSEGKRPGTQSINTPKSAWWQALPKKRKSSGEPKRLVGRTGRRADSPRSRRRGTR